MQLKNGAAGNRTDLECALGSVKAQACALAARYEKRRYPPISQGLFAHLASGLLCLLRLRGVRQGDYRSR